MPELWPLFTLILGVLLGGVANAIVGRYAAFRQGQGTAGALRAEIFALYEIIHLRNYIGTTARLVERLSKEDHQVHYFDILSIAMSHDYFTVYHAVAAKIGPLGTPTGPRIVRIYTFAKSLMEDVATLRTLRERVMKGEMLEASLNRLAIRDTTQTVHDFFVIISQEAQTAIAELTAYERRPWIRLSPWRRQIADR